MIPASNYRLHGRLLFVVSVLACVALCIQARAQDTLLPDGPSTAASFSSSVAATTPAPGFDARGASASVVLPLPEASHTEKYIAPDQTAPRLTVNDKVLLGIKDAFSPFAATGWFASAGYEQVLNGSPNYGTDRGAFGQRLGAAAIRDSSEGVFSDSVMSPLLHEDPRYYRLGPTHNFLARTLYAGTRPILTRTDGGHRSLNLALLSGTLGGAALTNLYYPQVNRGASQTLETFGGSLGGSAIGDVVSEFYEDFVHMLRIGHTQ
jgi:hypothetical protein